MERRSGLLRAAARVYAKYGYRGSTTRRIADEARVNEVTIFRQFGSKDTLIHEAIATCGGVEMVPDLPSNPSDPCQELTRWGSTVMEHLREMQSMVRRGMSEQEEHPQLAASITAGPIKASNVLRAYLLKLRKDGIVDEDFDERVVSSMFISSLFMDALERDSMPDLFPTPLNTACAQYARTMLKSIGMQLEEAVLS